MKRDINKYLSLDKDGAVKMMAEDHLKSLERIHKEFASQRNGDSDFNPDEIKDKFIEKIKSRLDGTLLRSDCY